MERVVLGGVSLSDSYSAIPISRPIPYVDSRFEHVPGTDGYELKEADILPQPIKIAIVANDADGRARRRAARQLASVLLKKEPVKVSFSSDDGLYYMAVPTGKIDFAEYVSSGAMTVTFQPIEAAMYGKERTVTVPSGGSVAFNVGGTYPARPKITASAVRDSSSQVWGLKLESGKFLHVATGSASARTVAIDCDARTCTVNSSASIPTLDSDWLELSPGTHTLQMDKGTGAATVTFTERWL